MSQMSELLALLERNIRDDGILKTAIPRLSLIRMSRPTEPIHAVQEPTFCLLAQGRKQVMLGESVFEYAAGHCFVVSIDLPLVGQVVEASDERPYLCIRLDLDGGQLGALMIEARQSVALTEPAQHRGVGVSLVSDALLDALLRMVRLLDTPQDIPVMAPLLEREIHYRLLTGEQRVITQQIATADQRLHSVHRVIHWLKRNYAAPFRMEHLAREAGMSSSALHQHFKAVTAMSPLQYQKRIRLQEARRMMFAEQVDAATAAHNVGYESPSQFTREYSRLFGASPSRDISRLKVATGSAGDRADVTLTV